MTAPSAVLMEASTGQVLFEKEAHQQRPCASITKVMTLCLTFEAIDSGRLSLDQTLTASAHAASTGGVNLGLRRRAGRSHELRMRLHQLHEQALLEVLLLVVRQPRREQLHVGGAQLVDVEAQRLGVAGHDGAVEVVAGGLVLLALPLGTGIQMKSGCFASRFMMWPCESFAG